jgi:hypothetical protein
MPCDRVYYTTVNLEVADRALLVKALEALGCRVDVITSRGMLRVNSPDGTFTLTETGSLEGRVPVIERVAPQIRQAYAAQAVVSAAQKFGWRVTTKGPQQLHLTRRR